MTWKLNGANLDSGTVKVVVEPGTAGESEAIRTQEASRLHARTRRHKTGEDPRRYRFRFLFVGPSPDRYQRLDAVRDQLRGSPMFTLEAPPSPNEFYPFDDSKKGTLMLDGTTIDYGEGVAAVALEVSATLTESAILGQAVGGPAVAETEVGLDDA